MKTSEKRLLWPTEEVSSGFCPSSGAKLRAPQVPGSAARDTPQSGRFHSICRGLRRGKKGKPGARKQERSTL